MGLKLPASQTTNLIHLQQNESVRASERDSLPALSLGPHQTTRKVIRMNNIPVFIQGQLESIFRVSGEGICLMKQRPLRLAGHDVKVWLELPPPKANHVIQAHILVTNARVENEHSQFVKQPISTSNGSRVTYTFYSWESFGLFLNRLPQRLPSNKITELYDEYNKLFSLFQFFFLLDRGFGHCTLLHRPISSMKKLQRELRSVGLSA